MRKNELDTVSEVVNDYGNVGDYGTEAVSASSLSPSEDKIKRRKKIKKRLRKPRRWKEGDWEEADDQARRKISLSSNITP